MTNTLAYCKAAIIASLSIKVQAPIVSFPGADILNSLQSQLTVAPKSVTLDPYTAAYYAMVYIRAVNVLITLAAGGYVLKF